MVEWLLEVLFGLCGGGIWLTLLYFEIWVRITGRGAPSGNDLATELFLFSSCLSSGYFPFLWGFSEKVTEPLQKTILLLNDNDSLFLWLAEETAVWFRQKEGARTLSWPRPEGKSSLRWWHRDRGKMSPWKWQLGKVPPRPCESSTGGRKHHLWPALGL